MDKHVSFYSPKKEKFEQKSQKQGTNTITKLDLNILSSKTDNNTLITDRIQGSSGVTERNNVTIRREKLSPRKVR